MFDAVDQGDRAAHLGAVMRPRRWYTDEFAPPRRDIKLTARLWRYRSLVRHKKDDAASYYGAASVRWRRLDPSRFA